MNAPTLFDLQIQPNNTLARRSDPATSHLAAKKVRAARPALVAAIRQCVQHLAPCTAFEIASAVTQANGRWDSSTVRTAIASAGLRAVDTEGRSPRGQRCIRYSL